MPDPSTRARDGDRDAAIEIVEAAWADGQIIQADRDLRVGQLLTAQTLGDIKSVVGGLQPPSGPARQPVTATPVDTVVSPSPRPVSSGESFARVANLAMSGMGRGVGGSLSGIMRRVLVWAVTGAVAIGVFGGGIGTLVSLFDTADSPGLPFPGGNGGVLSRGPDALSVKGLAAAVADLKEETGSSMVFEAVVYPEYAVLRVPVDGSSQREELYRWDGDLESMSAKSTSSYTRFDLADVNARLMVELSDKARTKLVDKPQSWYVIVRAGEESGGIELWAYANNEYHEGGYIQASNKGKVLNRITW